MLVSQLLVQWPSCWSLLPCVNGDLWSFARQPCAEPTQGESCTCAKVLSSSSSHITAQDGLGASPFLPRSLCFQEPFLAWQETRWWEHSSSPPKCRCICVLSPCSALLPSTPLHCHSARRGWGLLGQFDEPHHWKSPTYKSLAHTLLFVFFLGVLLGEGSMGPQSWGWTCLMHLSGSVAGGWEEGDAITPHEEPAAHTSPDTCVHVSFGWED